MQHLKCKGTSLWADRKKSSRHSVKYRKLSRRTVFLEESLCARHMRSHRCAHLSLLFITDPSFILGCTEKLSRRTRICFSSPLHSPNLEVLMLALVAQSHPTLCDPVDCSLPGFSVHGILQARILEWVAIPSSRGSSQPRDWTWVFCIGRCIFFFFFLPPSHQGRPKPRNVPYIQ